MRRPGRRYVFAVLLATGFVAVAVIASAAQARSGRPAATGVYTFSTATNQINGFFNQGWWSTTQSNDNSNTNYFVGDDFGNPIRDYFSFDISAVTNPCAPSSAYLTITDPGSGSGPANLTYGLYEVLTPATVLAQKDNNPNTAIYNDLGSGTNYGLYSLPTTPSGPYTLSLNSSGLSAIAAAHANHSTFFTVGGSLVGAPSGAFLMGFTGGSPVTLTVTFPRLCKVN